MTRIPIKIEEQDAEERMDIVLPELLENTSRSSIQKLIEKGNVCVNGTPVTSKKYKLKEGDLVEVRIEEPIPLQAEPENIPLEIVYEDADLLVVNKPKGMVVHPAAGNWTGTLVNGILYHCQDRLSSINGVIRPGIVHRIDKDTSGLLVVAKNDISHQALAEQFAAHTITRAYRAIVYNNFTEDQGVVNAPIGRDPRNRLRMTVTQKKGKQATTYYKVLERFGRFTYIEATLKTGRTHQIRVHMAHINHPLLGDELYGPKKSPVRTEGQVLHAKTLGFQHPSSGKYVEFDSPLPEGFSQVLNKLR
ncbi:MAG: RluA family pseudouridine synthase [Anaerovoracaceae bacterium]